MQVVLADDSAVVRRLVESVLGRDGHEVTAVADGAAAWAAFERIRPRLVILDWMMPGLSGLEVTRRIRAAEAGAEPFVLMITGNDAEHALAEALAAGVDDWIAKPVAAEHLQARVTIAARRIEQTDARRRAEEALARAQWLAGIGQTALALQHEINNPLTALLAEAQLLSFDELLPEQVRHQSDAIVRLARRIAEVVKRLSELQEPKAVPYVEGARMLDLSGRRTTPFGE